ncbi:unnamed protein product [Agarophyton chilense]|eukprot:gb/GEZJ01000521.1/.p1 GENE.gb/GEZJ01000521.1/~~gb/GEZJ01000521.1/.p1  ORF type:complete len:863 (+),score=137.91 gb/GEZJ01000521.1/:2221-4809(+)
MSSNSDMESVSISDVEMEDDEDVPAAVSQPVPRTSTPPAGVSPPESSLSQPNPRRITMRERAIALREARLRKTQAKNAKKQQEDATGSKQKQPLDDEEPEHSNDNGAIAPPSRQEPKYKRVRKTNSNPAWDSNAEDTQEDSQALTSKRQGAGGKKREASGTGRGRKAQSRKEKSTNKDIAHSKLAVRHENSNDPYQNEPGGDVPNGQDPPSNYGSKALKAGPTSRKDQRKRKSTIGIEQEKDERNDSGDDSDDVVFLQSTVQASPTPRTRKKARVEKAKPVTSPKLASKSQKKKKPGPQSPSGPPTSAPTNHADIDMEKDEIEVQPKKKKALRKTTPAAVRSLDDDEPLVVRNKRVDNTLSSKGPQASSVAEEEPKPVPPKRRPGRPRKYPRPEASKPQLPPKKIVEDEDEVGPVSEKQTLRQPKTRGRKPKITAPSEVESAKKSILKGDDDLDVSKANAAPHHASRSTVKRKPLGESHLEQNNKLGGDQEATDVVDDEEVAPKQISGGEKEVQAKDGVVRTEPQTPIRAKRVSYKEPGFRSATKLKRLSFGPSASRDSVMMASRRQSLSHQEGLSRLTSVVDQLQREGEAFLQTQQRVCDELVPLSSESGAHIVSNLAQGYLVNAPISEDDRRAIADATLRDAVMHAKLAYQALHRDAISRLAEDLVKAVKDWKGAKNAVLRDIIPDELRPMIGTPLNSIKQSSQKITPVTRSRIAINGKGGDVSEAENDEEIGELDENRFRTEFNANGTMTDQGRKSRDEAVAEIRSLGNVDAIRTYVGSAYSRLNLNCYRSCAILKLCEFDGGLTYDELYRITPLGKLMLRRKISNMVCEKYLMENLAEATSGRPVLLYETSPHTIRMR